MPDMHHPRYLLRWDHSRRLEIGRDTVLTRHRVGELLAANHEQLADLVDQHPGDAISIHTMGKNPSYRNQWQTGQMGRANGSQLIQAVQQGRLWVELEQVERYHESLRSLSNRLMQEIADCHVGLRIHNPTTRLVLASPGAMQYYRCDARPTIRWQLRGQQTILSYPPHEPFIERQCFEDACISGVCNGIYFEPAFDEHAVTCSVEPTQMISLPQTTPYRAMCEGFNVWLQTAFDDQASIRHRNICLADQKLRRWLPDSWCENRTTGIAATLKNTFAKIAGLDSKRPPQEPTNDPSFTVKAISQVSNVALASSELPLLNATTNTATVVLEN